MVSRAALQAGTAAASAEPTKTITAQSTAAVGEITSGSGTRKDKLPTIVPTSAESGCDKTIANAPLNTPIKIPYLHIVFARGESICQVASPLCILPP